MREVQEELVSLNDVMFARKVAESKFIIFDYTNYRCICVKIAVSINYYNMVGERHNLFLFVCNF
jgi:hypothetical protein